MNNFVIKNKKGTELTSLSAWEQGFIEVDDKKHWETGYSAYSLAQFFTERDGQQWLSNLMSDIFNDSFTITDARIEHESKLDKYSGKHRRIESHFYPGGLRIYPRLSGCSPRA